MADFIKNEHRKSLSPAILKGIELHRNIDRYTDNHPSVRLCTALLHETQGKYAPVTVDILFDNILSQKWSRYSDVPLIEFKDDIYATLADNMVSFPSSLQNIVPKMIKDDFLMSCATEDRLVQTFERVAKRAKFNHSFNIAHLDLRKHYDQLSEHFDVFFPELIEYVNDFCGCKN